MGKSNPAYRNNQSKMSIEDILLDEHHKKSRSAALVLCAVGC
jgi:hypothetical protein